MGEEGKVYLSVMENRPQKRLPQSERPSDELAEIATRLTTALIIAAHGDEREAVAAFDRAKGYVQDLALRLGVEAW